MCFCNDLRNSCLFNRSSNDTSTMLAIFRISTNNVTINVLIKTKASQVYIESNPYFRCLFVNPHSRLQRKDSFAFNTIFTAYFAFSPMTRVRLMGDVSILSHALCFITRDCPTPTSFIFILAPFAHPIRAALWLRALGGRGGSRVWVYSGTQNRPKHGHVMFFTRTMIVYCPNYCP